MAESDQSGPSPLAQAIILLREARAGVLATVKDGQPYASLVTPATATLHNLKFTFLELSSTMPALKNTFILAVSSATVGGLLALLIALIVVCVNLVADILYAVLDPRVA